ncbi:unnamed protein product, partial [Discosporangium mesarthrocarpum]
GKVVPPGRVRPREDMWFCSGSYHILDAEVRSSSVKAGFGWDRPLDPVVVARQITGMARVFPEPPLSSGAALGPDPGHGALLGEEDGAVAGGGGDKSSMVKGVGKSMEAARQKMAGVVPQLYQLLSDAVESEG